MTYELKPIGVAHTQFKNISEVPRCSKEFMYDGCIEIFPEYADCIIGLERHKNIFAFAWMHQSDRSIKIVSPRIDKDRPPQGVFATRSPVRPNPIGLTLLDLVRIDGLKLYVKGVDFLDGTPIIDIKKYDQVLDTP